MMESQDLMEELQEVESQLVCVQREIDGLLERQKELLERKQLLSAQLESISTTSTASSSGTSSHHQHDCDWENGVFEWSEQVTNTLKSFFKLESFRPLQLSCINATLSGKDVILIMPTGGGKSLCYQLPAVVNPNGVTLVVSPLVSLMEDQLMSVKILGIDSCMLNASCSREVMNHVHGAMTDKSNTMKLLYVTPEKISKSKRFMSKLEKMYEMGRMTRIVIDEVHCVSQWGHDFRPDYKILGILKRQFPNAPILGLTATATSKVLADVRDMLSMKECVVFRASYNRTNLFYEVRAKQSSHKAQIDDMAALIKAKFDKKSGIVYCLSRKDTEQVSMDLCQKGIRASCYHADLPANEKTRVHTQWLKNKIQVIVATVAFGMGIDKSNVRFVLHHTISKSMENYYQESGRAGRDGQQAHCVLYFRAGDAFRQSTMVFTEHTGLPNLYTMLNYCLNEVECRRALIAKSFGETWQQTDCHQQCDICYRNEKQTESSSSSGAANTTTLSSKVNCKATFCTIVDEDITEHCGALVEIIEHAQSKDQRLTALKLIDSWRGHGSTTNRAKHVPVTKLPEVKCEKILLRTLLDGVLKEEFHFTPYSTISYIGLGRSTIAVKRGLLRVTMKVCKTDSLSATKSHSAGTQELVTSSGTKQLAIAKQDSEVSSKKAGTLKSSKPSQRLSYCSDCGWLKKRDSHNDSCNSSSSSSLASKKEKGTIKRKLPSMLLGDSAAYKDDSDFLFGKPTTKQAKLNLKANKDPVKSKVIEILDSD